MPYAFTLPTTSPLAFSSILPSNTHPSLPLEATIRRSVLRDILKKHKRLEQQSRTSSLLIVLSALCDFVPFLAALDSGLSEKPVSNEEIDIVLQREPEVSWRSTLVASIPGHVIPRVKGRGLDFELCFVLHTLACTHSLLARAQIHSLSASSTLTSEQKILAITTAKDHLLEANSLHSFIVGRVSEVQSPLAAIDISSSTQSALASLALAEATLLAVLKDDPYPAIVAQSRNKDDRDWMIKAPEIPKVRAHLFARLCVAAGDHAGKANALLGSSNSGKGKGVNEGIQKYTKYLRKSSRAKACRFFGIDAELGGKTGEGIAWLSAGRKELGLKSNVEELSRLNGFSKLKLDWVEKREDKKIEKGGAWGSDGGKLEEARVIDMLEKKWNKMNDTVRKPN